MDQIRDHKGSGDQQNRPPLVGGSEELWIYAEKLIAESANKGYFP